MGSYKLLLVGDLSFKARLLSVFPRFLPPFLPFLVSLSGLSGELCCWLDWFVLILLRPSPILRRPSRTLSTRAYVQALILLLFSTLWCPSRTLSTNRSVPVLKSSECLRSFKCLDDCGLGGSQQSVSQIHEHITRVFVYGHLYQERIATLAIQLDFGERKISITWKWLLVSWSFP